MGTIGCVFPNILAGKWAMGLGIICPLLLLAPIVFAFREKWLVLLDVIKRRGSNLWLGFLMHAYRPTCGTAWCIIHLECASHAGGWRVHSRLLIIRSRIRSYFISSQDGSWVLLRVDNCFLIGTRMAIFGVRGIVHVDRPVVSVLSSLRENNLRAR
jgi:hypothetical protein